MTTDQTLLFALFAAVFGLLLWGRIRYDVVAFGALIVGVVTGLVPKEDAFSGFGHPATLIVALVLIVSAGLVRAGAVALITRTLVDPGRALQGHIALMGGIAGVLSAFMNNVAALALLMPVDIETARKAGRAARLTLMPLSFATILGGMATLIGTPPNIIISAIREDSLGAPFAMFDFAPVGAAAALAGIAFVALVGWRLIPAGSEGRDRDRAGPGRGYLCELVLPEGSALDGQPVADLRAAARDADVTVRGLRRGDTRHADPADDMTLAPGDVLLVEAAPAALEELRSAQGLAAATPERLARLDAAGGDPAFLELVLTPDSRLVGRSAQTVGLGWRRGALLVGLAREGRTGPAPLRATPLRAGDVLLILAPASGRDDLADWLDALPLAGGAEVTREGRTWLAIGLFAAAVLAASLGLVYLPIALGAVVVAYVLTGILPLRDLYTPVEWPVIVLLGSMIPLGAALEASGGTDLLAGALIGLTEGLPAWAILAVLMAVTMTLSDVLNNTATTIVAAPVAISMAERLGVSPDPFLMAVAVAASAAFLTPIGHKNNTLILGPGGYAFGDYWRMGLPLEALILVVSIPVLLVAWPL